MDPGLIFSQFKRRQISFDYSAKQTHSNISRGKSALQPTLNSKSDVPYEIAEISFG